MQARIASILAVLACASHVVGEAMPYRPFVASTPRLLRRDTGGYKPETSHCGAGDTCAQACGADFDTCSSKDSSTHCFNPKAGQACCADGSGNSCDAGFYCTHDHKKQTWCCPDSMDLTACAAAFSVKGGLMTAVSTTTTTTTTTHTAAYTPPPMPTPTVTPTPTPTYESSTPSSTGSSATSSSKGSTTSSGPVPTNTNAAGANSMSALLLVAAGLVALV